MTFLANRTLEKPQTAYENHRTGLHSKIRGKPEKGASPNTKNPFQIRSILFRTKWASSDPKCVPKSKDILSGERQLQKTSNCIYNFSIHNIQHVIKIIRYPQWNTLCQRMELPWDIYDHVLENQTRKFYIKLGPIKQIHGNLVTTYYWWYFTLGALRIPPFPVITLLAVMVNPPPCSSVSG